jgi:hypothetical protein
METIDEIVMSFKNQSKPWEFYDFVNKNLLEDKDRKLFNEIWEKAFEKEFFNNSDLMMCCEECRKYIKEHYILKEDTIKIIVNMMSYNWK